MQTFQANLLSGIDYYRNLAANVKQEATYMLKGMLAELNQMEKALMEIRIPQFSA